jgi:hypothetical protein
MRRNEGKPEIRGYRAHKLAISMGFFLKKNK